LDQVSHINKLKLLIQSWSNYSKELNPENRKRINVKVNHNLLSLSVHARTIIMRHRELKIVTLQDIKSELDMHEMDSWQKINQDLKS